MRFIIRSEIGNRLRVHADVPRMSLEDAGLLEYYIKNIPGVSKAKVYDRTCDAVIEYSCARNLVEDALAHFSFDDEEAAALVPANTTRSSDREYENRLINKTIFRFGRYMFLPSYLRMLWTAYRTLHYFKEAVKKLWLKKLSVEVLDGAAITASLLRGDYDTAASVMYFLELGDIMEEWARKKSIQDLAGMMSLNVDKAWVEEGGAEKLVSVSSIREGDTVIVRTGAMIPLDGKVCGGLAMVNQQTMTGESMPVKKSKGSYVYGGTAVEEGEIRITVDKTAGSGRYDRIVKMIEESENLKSATESQAAALADRLVPYSLGGTILAYLLTGNIDTAMAFLMVDYSCALKLTMPLAVLAGMREASRHRITVKGGKFLEDISGSDTLIFDKTGTLTNATPRVAEVIPFGGNDENEMLRIAACLEEHYPHSLAAAVVDAAKERKLEHEEIHSEVKYVVAHGITSYIEGMKVSIGSHHFIFEDEKCRLPRGEKSKFDSLPEEYSLLYLAVSGRLAAVICIDDPVKVAAAEIISELRKRGFSRLVMMTGDNEKSASFAASKVGVDEYISQALPEDKANFIRSKKAEGHTVLMVGDGVNDSPALSEADVGIAVNTGASIAKEISDVMVEDEDLGALITLKDISDALMKRISRDYRFIIGFNSALILSGVLGLITPGTSALLHNLSTIGISLYNMTDLIPES